MQVDAVAQYMESRAPSGHGSPLLDAMGAAVGGTDGGTAGNGSGTAGLSYE